MTLKECQSNRHTEGSQKSKATILSFVFLIIIKVDQVTTFGVLAYII